MMRIYLRNFIFGVEDSLVSTVGLLAGIAWAGIARSEIIVTGIVLIFVEAFSMSVGSFLSERTTEESYPGFKQHRSRSLPAAGIMFVSYLLCGLIPLAPYLLTGGITAFAWSIALSLCSLFALGWVSAALLKMPVARGALRMAIVGGIAIGVGIMVGIVIP